MKNIHYEIVFIANVIQGSFDIMSQNKTYKTEYVLNVEMQKSINHAAYVFQTIQKCYEL